MKTFGMWNKTWGMEPQICSIKKEFLNLQQKMEQAMKNLDLRADSDSNCEQKRGILQKARILCNDILETHDRKADCACFIGKFAKPDEGDSSEEGQQRMFEHLNTLTKILGQLDLQPKEDGMSKAVASSKPLNPLSKSFVPSAKIYQQLANSNTPRRYESKYIFDGKTGEWKQNYGQTNPIAVLSEEANGYLGVIKPNPPALRSVLLANEKAKWALLSKVKEIWMDTPETDYCPVQYPCLLTCFYGLHRNANAYRPLIRLRKRGTNFTSIWSVRPHDMKLWNNSTVVKPCSCPPIFGYNIPPDFFGNPFNLKYTCCEKGIHMNHYPNVHQNDDELDISTYNNSFFSLPLKESRQNEREKQRIEQMKARAEADRQSRLNYYKKAFKDYVTEICDITRELENLVDVKRTQQLLPEDKPAYIKTVQERLFAVRNGSWKIDNRTGSWDARNAIGSGVMSFAGVQGNGSSLTSNWAKDTSSAWGKENQKTCDFPCSNWCNSHNPQMNMKRKAASNTHICSSQEWGNNLRTAPQLQASYDKNMGMESTGTIVFRVPSHIEKKHHCEVLDFIRETTSHSNVNTAIVNGIRPRRDSIDSGYDSMSQKGNELNFNFPQSSQVSSFNIWRTNNSDASGNENYWTPLPDCNSDGDRKNTSNRPYDTWTFGLRRNSFKLRRQKFQKPFQSLTDKSNDWTGQRKEPLKIQQRPQNNPANSEGSRLFRESDFPSLKN